MASIGQALFPRSTERASIPAYHPRAMLDAAFDVASMPGRAYASLGRPSAESYSDALARTGPTGAMPGAMYQSEGDEFADMILRDPFLPLGAMLSAAAPVRALGQYGRAGVEGAFNAGGSMADQYATTGRAELAPFLLAGVAGAAPGMLPAGRQTRAAMISPDDRAANFRRWFGDSKLVDEAGNPLVVYHGSKYGTGGEFKPDKGYIGAAFFTDNKDNATKWAQGYTPDENNIFTRNDGDFSGEVVEAHISAKKPITDETSLEDVFGDADEAERFRDEAPSYDPQPFTASIDPDSDLYHLAHAYAQFPTFRKYLKKQGYDAFYFDDLETGGKTITPFEPAQIKSATGNRGTFDPSDQNITHLAAPKPATRAATPIKTLGSRLSAQAKHAALREYLSDDRPQGDTHYTSRSRR